MVQMEQCSGCNRPILDQFIHSVLDKSWHRECIKCVDCHILLTDRCYSREGQLFCRFDFLRRYGPKCQVCLEPLQASELVRQSRGNVYHLKCFTCSVCRKQLSTGEHYYLLEGNRFICQADYASVALQLPPVSTATGEGGLPTVGAMLGAAGLNGAVGDKDLDPDSNEVSLSGVLAHPDTHTSPSQAGIGPPVSTSGTTTGHQHDLLLAGVLHRAGVTGGVGVDNTGGVGGASHNTSSSADMEDMLLNPSVSDDGEMMPGFVKDEDEDEANNNLNTEDSCKLGLMDNDNASLDDLKSSYSASTPDGKGLGGGDGGSEMGLGDQGSTSGGQGGPGGQGSGTKRRGPRTTIKAKQLDTLKSAFAATPKPTRHVREQLAQETGLSMRVIQVWFQNRRSKERRMKQLSAMGARRPFFRNPRRMRTLRGGLGPDDLGPDGTDLMGNPAYHGYFTGNHPDFYNAVAAAGGFVPGGPYPGEFFHPVHGQPGHPPTHFLTNTPVSMAPGLPDTPGLHDERFLMQPGGGPLEAGFYSAVPDGFPPGPPGGILGGPPSPGGGGRHLDSPFQVPPCSMAISGGPGGFLPGGPGQQIGDPHGGVVVSVPNMEAW